LALRKENSPPLYGCETTQQSTVMVLSVYNLLFYRDLSYL